MIRGTWDPLAAREQNQACAPDSPRPSQRTSPALPSGVILGTSRSGLTRRPRRIAGLAAVVLAVVSAGSAVNRAFV